MTAQAISNTAIDWSKCRVLVTGGTGFIGQHLVRAIAGLSPAQLIVVGRTVPLNDTALPATFVSLDLTDREAVLNFGHSNRFTHVFHLAGKIDQSISPHIYSEMFRLHTLATLNLLAALNRDDLIRLVCVGSNAEYGNARCPHGEFTHEEPNSAYGASKLAATKFVMAKSASEGFPVTVVRPFLVYGPGQPQQSFLGKALAAARAGQPFPTTLGEQTRDFVHVSKVVSDLLHIMAAPECSGRTFNSCTGRETKLREVLLKIKEFYPEFVPLFGKVAYRQTELMRSVGEPVIPVDAQQAWLNLEGFIRKQF